MKELQQKLQEYNWRMMQAYSTFHWAEINIRENGLYLAVAHEGSNYVKSFPFETAESMLEWMDNPDNEHLVFE